MDIQNKEGKITEERLLMKKLASREFCAGRQNMIRELEELLWEWNQEEYRFRDREPLQLVTGRIKTPASIVEKLKRKGYEISCHGAESLHDVTGVRAVCGYLDDVYRLRNYILNCDRITVLQEKDYIQRPKKTGYQSLHMILRLKPDGARGGIEPEELSCERGGGRIVELQIRTITMDHWSSLEHPTVYKRGKYAAQRVGKELTAYAGLLRKMDRILLVMRMEKELYERNGAVALKVDE